MSDKTLHVKTWPLENISRFRGVLMGAAVLWLVWYHSDMRFDAVPPFYRATAVAAALLHTMRTAGNAGADVFLLLSGVGLYHSFEKTPDTFRFYKKRALRVLPPVLIVSVIWAGMNGAGGFLNYFARVFLLDYFTEGNSICWYVNLLLILYLFYPLLHRFLRRFGARAAVVSIALSVALAALLRICAPTLFWRFFLAVPRIPVFICGALLGKAVFEKKEVSRRWLRICAAFFTVCWIWFMYESFRPLGFREAIVLRFYLYCPFAVSAVVLGSAFFARFSVPRLQKVLAWFGGLSLEIYLLYERTAMSCRRIFPVDDRMHIVYYVPVFVTAVLLSVALQQVCGYLKRTLFDRKQATGNRKQTTPKEELLK